MEDIRQMVVFLGRTERILGTVGRWERGAGQKLCDILGRRLFSTQLRALSGVIAILIAH